MLLKNKNAVIYGAGGSLGGAMARAFAKEGANVFVSGRNMAPLEIVVKDILASGGKAEAAVVDALNEKAVNDYVDAITSKAGSVDISYNAIGVEAVQGIPLYEMKVEDFMDTLKIGMTSQLITSSAAAKHMIKNGSGVILFLSATPGGIAYPATGGFGVLCNALEGFSRNLAAELGPKGVRVVGMRSAGSPDSAVFKNAVQDRPAIMEPRLKEMIDDTMLKRLPLMREITNVAVFLASDLASGMTGTTANITCGTTMD
ncbi:MAG TPA: SDR family oxidoreductase [Chitinophagaceae bacterium]|nr:SDR family oxidoreductase [Chitinophagaceae bacterium]